MPTLFETKYPNNSRVVSGVVTIYRDDVVLLCDTSIAPVVINLFDIPANYWSTQWKLYIIDNSNNASANNITINAGVGQNINTQANLVLNTDGSGALVRIVSDTNFIGNLTSVSGGSGGGYSVIQDEGVSLPQRTILDFVGEFVEATDNGIKTTATINPIIKEITNADLQTEIINGTLIKGLSYRVIDTDYSLNVTLMAIETNRVQYQGAAEYICADYDLMGDYSGVVGFQSQLGIWNALLTPIIGDVVIYDNSHWVNISGVNFPFDNTNWILLDKTVNNGYIYNVFTVDYNIGARRPERIWDNYGNLVEYADPKGVITFDNFPFGNSAVKQNTIIGKAVVCQFWHNTIFETCENNYLNNGAVIFEADAYLSPLVGISCSNNFINRGNLQFKGFVTVQGIVFSANIINGGSIEIFNRDIGFGGAIFCEDNNLNRGVLSIGGSGGVFNGTNNILVLNNQMTSNGDFLSIGSIDTTSLSVNISDNKFSNFCVLNINTIDNSQFERNILSVQGSFDWGSTILSSNATQGGIDSILSLELSTFKKVLDVDDPLVYDPVTNTLVLGNEQWVGIYLISGIQYAVCDKITGGNTYDIPYKIVAFNQNVGTDNFALNALSLNFAVANDIVSNFELASNLNRFRFYNTLTESATLKRAGNLNFVISVEKWSL